MVNLSSLGCSNAIIQQRVTLSTLIMLTYHTPVYTLTERLQEFFYNQRTHPCAGLSRNYLTEALAQCDATRRNPASSNELHTKLEDWVPQLQTPMPPCGYPIEKMELDIQARFPAQHPFSCCIIISDRNIWRLPAAQFHFWIIFGYELNTVNCRWRICNRISFNQSRLQERWE